MPAGFMAALAEGLELTEAEKAGLDRSYTFDEATSEAAEKEPTKS